MSKTREQWMRYRKSFLVSAILGRDARIAEIRREEEEVGCEPPGVAEATDAMFKAVRHGKTTFGKMAAEFDVLHGRASKEAE